MTASEIIQALGGRLSVAEITGAKPNAVTQWRKAGIPPFYWHKLVGAAAEKQIQGVTFETLQSTREMAA
jgi:hypothetical protein